MNRKGKLLCTAIMAAQLVFHAGALAQPVERAAETYESGRLGAALLALELGDAHASGQLLLADNLPIEASAPEITPEPTAEPTPEPIPEPAPAAISGWRAWTTVTSPPLPRCCVRRDAASPAARPPSACRLPGGCKAQAPSARLRIPAFPRTHRRC